MPRGITDWVKHEPEVLDRGLRALCRGERRWESRTTRPLKDGCGFFLQVLSRDASMPYRVLMSGYSKPKEFAVSSRPGTMRTRWLKEHVKSEHSPRDTVLERFMRRRGWVPVARKGYDLWQPSRAVCETCPHLLACSLEGVIDVVPDGHPGSMPAAR